MAGITHIQSEENFDDYLKNEYFSRGDEIYKNGEYMRSNYNFFEKDYDFVRRNGIYVLKSGDEKRIEDYIREKFEVNDIQAIVIIDNEKRQFERAIIFKRGSHFIEIKEFITIETKTGKLITAITEKLKSFIDSINKKKYIIDDGYAFLIMN